MYSEVSVAARSKATTGAPMRPADFSENDGIADDDESVDACSRDGDDAEDDAEDDADDQARLPVTS